MDERVNEPSPPPSPAYRDRTGLLIFFGCIQAALGVLCFLMAALMIGLQFFVSAMEDEALQQMQSTVGPAIIYGLGGVCLVWLGVGSMMARRWARALNLTLSSMMLAIGAISLVSMVIVFLAGDLNLQLEGQEEVPPGFMIGVFVVMFIVMFGIYIAIPGAFVLVYRSPHVKATCEHKDPKIRWTDKCPLPVLAVSLFCGIGAVSFFSMIFWMNVFPFFGTVLVGLPAGVLLIVFALALASISWGMYKLKSPAWWGCLILIILGFTMSSITFFAMDAEALYEAMGTPAEQIDMMRSMGILDMMTSPAMAGWTVVMGFVYVGYLLYVRRYFVAAENPYARPMD